MKHLALYIMLGLCGEATAQHQTLLNGLVLNGETMYALENVNVQNISRHTLAASNREGAFSIYVGEKDTLKLTAIGFEDYTVSVREVLNKAGSFVVVMIPTAYSLDELTINPFGTYQQFKWKVLALKLPPPVDYMAMLGLQKPVVPLVPPEYDYKKVYHPLAAVFHPVSYFYKRYNKEERAKIEYYRFLYEEWPEIKVVQEKYNGGRVTAITGLEGDSLTRFMEFCNFDHHYLYQTPEYEIGEAIVEKLKAFRKLNIEMKKPEE